MSNYLIWLIVTTIWLHSLRALTVDPREGWGGPGGIGPKVQKSEKRLTYR